MLLSPEKINKNMTMQKKLQIRGEKRLLFEKHPKMWVPLAEFRQVFRFFLPHGLAPPKNVIFTVLCVALYHELAKNVPPSTTPALNANHLVILDCSDN